MVSERASRDRPGTKTIGPACSADDCSFLDVAADVTAGTGPPRLASACGDCQSGCSADRHREERGSSPQHHNVVPTSAYGPETAQCPEPGSFEIVASDS